MIEIKAVRRVQSYRRCPVCRDALAPNGSNTRVTIDAETEATAITTLTHARCAETIINFTRARGYTPAELAKVGVWAEESSR